MANGYKTWLRINLLLWAAAAVLALAALLLTVRYFGGQAQPSRQSAAGPFRTLTRPATTQPRETAIHGPAAGVTDSHGREAPVAREQEHEQEARIALDVPIAQPRVTPDSAPDSLTDSAGLLHQPREGRPAGAESELARRAGPQSLFANRSGPRRAQAIERFGGGANTARAIDDSLAWLATHQDASGRWDRAGFERHCPPGDRCGDAAIGRLDRTGDVAVTSLVLLAFFADGHLPTDTVGLYRETTRRGVGFVVGQQQPGGQLGRPDVAARANVRNPGEVQELDPLMMYNHAIGTLALAEAYALTRDRRLIEPVQAATDFLARTQQPEGGWDYWSHVTHRNDTSITGWVVCALCTVRASGLDVPADTLYRALRFLDSATDPNGEVLYANLGTGVTMDRTTGAPRYRYGPATAALATFNRQLLGASSGSDAVRAGVARLAGELPSVRAQRGETHSLHSDYYWYYGSLAMFQAASVDRAWTAWWPAASRTVLGNMDRTAAADGRRAHRYGSTGAYGKDWGHNWGACGGRVYSTAMAALTLQTPYRYAPLSQMPADAIFVPFVEAELPRATPARRLAMLGWIGQLRPQLAEPILYRLVRMKDYRFAAAVQMAHLGNPAAARVINERINALGAVDRLAAEQALAALGNAAMPDPVGTVTQIDVRAGWVELSVPGYVGYAMPVVVHDATGAPLLRLTVQQIDRDSRTAVARIDAADRPRGRELTPGQQARFDAAALDAPP